MTRWIVLTGNTSEQDFLIKDKNGDPVENLADAEYVKFQVKTHPRGELLISKTHEDGIERDVPGLGYCRITLLPSDTAQLPGLYYMALEVKWSEEEKYETRIYINQIETWRFEIKENMISD